MAINLRLISLFYDKNCACNQQTPVTLLEHFIILTFQFMKSLRGNSVTNLGEKMGFVTPTSPILMKLWEYIAFNNSFSTKKKFFLKKSFLTPFLGTQFSALTRSVPYIFICKIFNNSRTEKIKCVLESSL